MTDAITIQNPRNRGGSTGHVLAKRSVTFTEIRIKHYFGCSENAVRLQIYSALLAFLLLHAYRRQSGAAGSIYEFATHLAYSLFERPAAMLKADERRRNQAQCRIAMGSLQL